MCNRSRYLLVAILSLGLLACHQDFDQASADDLQPNLTAYTIGGTATGLTGSLTLRNNINAETRVVSAAGSFLFSTPVTQGLPYEVVITAQPTGQTCTLSNGSGLVGTANVTNITVNCTTNGLTLGGTVTGLAPGASLVLQASAGSVWGSHTITANGAFTFPLNFVPNNEYLVFVMTQPAAQTCTVANSEGDIGSSSITNIAVTCINSSPSSRNWQTAANITTDTDPADTNSMRTPVIKFDGSGNALAIWAEDEQGNSAVNLMWSRRPAGGAWSTPAQIPDWVADNGEIRREPVLAVRADGYAVAAWKSGPAFLGYHVMASTFTPAGGWTPPEFIWFKHADLPSGAENLRISIDDQGRALLIWEAAGIVYYNRHLPGTGWIPTVQYSGHPVTPIQTPARDPELAMNAAGQAVAMWRQQNLQVLGSPEELFISRYDMTADTWSAPQTFNSTSNGLLGKSLVIDGAGTVTALWTAIEGQRTRIMFNRIGLNTVGTSAFVETGNTIPQGYAFGPLAVIDGAGNIVTVWKQGDVSDGHFVANRYVPGTGWGTQQEIGQYAGSSSVIFDTDFTLGGNAAGHVVAVWTLPSCIEAENVPCPTDLHANEYNPVNGNWGAEEVIDKEYTYEGEVDGNASTPAVAVDANGNAIAVWDQDNGGPTTDGIRYARYQ
jgi:hypothetical protein